MQSGIISFKEKKLDLGAVLAGHWMQENELASSLHPVLMRVETGEKSSYTFCHSQILLAKWGKR